jgi:hypothetical protein
MRAAYERARFNQQMDRLTGESIGAIAYSAALNSGMSDEKAAMVGDMFSAAMGVGGAASGYAPAFTGAKTRVVTTMQAAKEEASAMLSRYSPVERMAMGRMHEAEQVNLAKSQGNVAEQLRVRAYGPDGKLLPGYVKLDLSGNTGQFYANEYKLSINSPLTNRQAQLFPNLELYGGKIVGSQASNIGYPKGTILPPTLVNIKYFGPQGN